jgi:hypothetical protein
MSALTPCDPAAGMSVVTARINLTKRGAAMSAVSINTMTLNTHRTTRPAGFEGVVYRLGLTLVAWSRSRNGLRPTPQEQQELARERARMIAERERDALSGALLFRNI